MRAMRIQPNSQIDIIDIDGGSVEDELHALQDAVGGYIETIRMKDGGIMIVDEEGVLKQYQHNDMASYIIGFHIFGTALIVGDGGEVFDDVPQQYIDAYMR